jgi:hypothetical protein
MILFFTNFLMAVVFIIMAFDQSKNTGQTIWYLAISALNWISCIVILYETASEPVKPVVDKFLLI